MHTPPHAGARKGSKFDRHPKKLAMLMALYKQDPFYNPTAAAAAIGWPVAADVGNKLAIWRRTDKVPKRQVGGQPRALRLSAPSGGA